MGFWHTGYIEFHEPVGLAESIGPPPAPEYRCEQCSGVFPSFELLRMHRFEEHPAVRPVLFIRGREVGGATLRVTRPLVASDVQTLNAKTAFLNDHPVVVSKLGDELARQRSATTIVRLCGTVDADFRVQVEIAAADDLAGVESAFASAVRRGKLDRRAIEDLIADARPFRSALAYCDGICEYLYGVLAKERSPHSALPFSEYREKFNRAADILRDIDRPLSRVVQGLVAFHFNHFESAASAAPATRFAEASRRLASLLRPDPHHPTQNADSSAAVDEVLTDWDTERIIRWSLSPASDLLLHRNEIEALIDKDLAEFDRAKLRVILAEAYAREDHRTNAARHARELRNSPTFGQWAETIVKRTT